MAATAAATDAAGPRFIDIGVNLTDPVFRGNYHGKQAHPDDFDQVLQRAHDAGVIGQIITGGNLQESRQALELAQQHPTLYSTAGCHPTRTSEIESHPDGAHHYLEQISDLIRSSRARQPPGSGPGKIVAIGECGLDYDRLHFAPADVQRRHFAAQLDLAVRWRLPLFLHSRAAHDDLVRILRPRIDEIHHALSSPVPAGTHPAPHADPHAKRVGVVHSFTGSVPELVELLDLGLLVGLNGCSLKTEANLAAVRHLPLERLLLETDAPWCDPRPTHASAPHVDALRAAHPGLVERYQPAAVKKERWRPDAMVKGRNEPCVIGAVAAAVASVKGVPLQEVADAARRNTEWLFGL